VSEFLDRISKLSPQRLALLADSLNRQLQEKERERNVPLAIVGMGCNLPGGVHSPEEFWVLLREGRDAIGEVPASRWNIDALYSANPETPGKMSTRWGGFVDGIDEFDPRFFGIAPAEAVAMDPQQRLLLETSWQALENAGIAPAKTAGSPAGVFVGICNGDYGQILFDTGREKITPYFASGLSHAIASGRISYVLGLQGPSLAVDTSCSASLVAVHLACQSLRLGECDLALAGGVNVVLNPEVTIALSQAKMMAPDGHCKAFAEGADGFVRAEGCGIIVLRRLPDAIRDGNRILAVVRGTACNQDGRSSGLTAPNGLSQERVITAALANAGMEPDAIDAIEAHGTGTALGDPIEAGALNEVFATATRNSDPLWIGSVKTNLGHLESAAGIAGLIKLVLALQHRELPPSLHFTRPSSHIDWNSLPLKVPTRLEPWKKRGETRAAGISSFGFSGTNAHVILEEYLEPAHPASTGGDVWMFPLSAKSPQALRALATRYAQFLGEHPKLELVDIAHTLASGRSHFEYRAAIVAASLPELLDQLQQLQREEISSGIQTGHATLSANSVHIAFNKDGLPSPESSELCGNDPAVRAALQQAEAIIQYASQAGWNEESRRKVLEAAGALYVLGCEIRLKDFHGNVARSISLPTYPFERQRYWPAPARNRESTETPVPVVASQMRFDAFLDDPLEARKAKIVEYVTQQAREILGYRNGEPLPSHLALTDAGLDSLMAVELKNRLQAALGQELSSTVIFDCGNVHALAEMLEARLWAARSGPGSGMEASQKEEIVL
jgi:myxalamid-type polyketide synthase MxaE and MxaD